MLYPPESSAVKENSFEYQDPAAVVLYHESNAGQLIGMHARLMRVLESQTVKIEQYPATPHTTSQAETITKTLAALEAIQLQMSHWHRIVYPNSVIR